MNIGELENIIKILNSKTSPQEKAEKLGVDIKYLPIFRKLIMEKYNKIKSESKFDDGPLKKTRQSSFELTIKKYGQMTTVTWEDVEKIIRDSGRNFSKEDIIRAKEIYYSEREKLNKKTEQEIGE